MFTLLWIFLANAKYTKIMKNIYNKICKFFILVVFEKQSLIFVTKYYISFYTT